MDRRIALKKTGLLIGAGLSFATTTSILQSCADKPAEKTWKPEFLSEELTNVLGAISEILIPVEQVPEAAGLQIPRYIDTILKDFSPPGEQQAFLKGFDQFKSDCQDQCSNDFLNCPRQQQLDFLKNEEKKFVENPVPNFFGTVKLLTYEVFFNTEVGVTQYLKYQPVPGTYEGCVPLSEVNGTWFSHDMFTL